MADDQPRYRVAYTVHFPGKEPTRHITPESYTWEEVMAHLRDIQSYDHVKNATVEDVGEEVAA